MTRPVAAMDSCFGLVRPHQHGIAVAGQQIGQKALCTLPFTAEAGAKYPFNLVCESRSYTWLFITGTSSLFYRLSNYFDTFQTPSENIQKRLSGIRTTFGESSESVRKSSENRQKVVISMLRSRVRYQV